eukprot:TRINITY_DN1923_c0_g1_i1.p1 TRINITY_DN1923_c0_g1~~TRINITY_DN1923_c0_g1_i1.p1  ORF type:complete len:200 (+),score=37.94 TRINITY_DN1923_c0_g1_i1:78-602(+)
MAASLLSYLPSVASGTAGFKIEANRTVFDRVASHSTCTFERRSVVAMAGGGGGVEQDIPEEFRPYWSTPGEDLQQNDTFKYGKVDGAHSFHKGDEGNFSELLAQALEAAGGPTGFQRVYSALFLPGLFSMVAFGAPPEYFMGYTALFIFAFIGQEMAKPAKPSSFEPEMYRVKK